MALGPCSCALPLSLAFVDSSALLQKVFDAYLQLPPTTQSFQQPLVKEYTINHTDKPLVL